MDTSSGYGQYCPITRALELLGERWTLLIVRDMIVGADRFNDLSRGLPGLSRSLLSRRLRALESAGIVERDDQRYVLTPSGRDLESIVFGLGTWGARWAFGPPRDEELDAELLLWWAHSRIDVSALPDRRVVIAFALSDPRFRAWLLIDDAGVSVCKSDPGFGIDATITCTVAVLSGVWLGRLGILDAMRAGRVLVDGMDDVVRVVPDALRLSPVAALVRAESISRQQ